MVGKDKIAEDVKNASRQLTAWLEFQKGSGIKGYVDKRRGGVKRKRETLEDIEKDLGNCVRCKLSKERTNIVFGVGNPKADLMFIGEGPGRDEDIQGEPFVGRAGQLLTKIIQAMKMERSDVYIANVVKCRPPSNRTPMPDEVAECLPFLNRQIEAVRPSIIVLLGSVAVGAILGPDKKISAIRGTWQEYNGVPVMPTYHPAYLLRNPGMKRVVWNDMKKVMSKLKGTKK